MLHSDDNCATKVALLLTIAKLASALPHSSMSHLVNS
jgi:hypothetical protein